MWGGQSATDMTVADWPFSAMNEWQHEWCYMKIHVLLSSNMNGVYFFLWVRCLYNEQNNTCLLWDKEFLFLCSTQYLTGSPMCIPYMIDWSYFLMIFFPQVFVKKLHYCISNCCHVPRQNCLNSTLFIIFMKQYRERICHRDLI